MENIEVQIISRELIKPSSPTSIQHQKPYKLCLFSQLTPTSYSPIILFYTMQNEVEGDRAVTRMKTSLSDTLNLYYPFSGRTKDNIFYDQFNEGVPFLDARVNCSMSWFLKRQGTEPLLNELLPCQPFMKEMDLKVPAMLFQVSRFTCGSIALGWCASHKITDGFTAKAFITTWGAISRANYSKIVNPELDEPSSYFPPIEPPKRFPQNHLALMESLWFTEANYITKRFVFNAKALSELRAKARACTKQDNSGNESKKRISRVEALSCFIWKSFMSASTLVNKGKAKPTILVQAVNLRSRIKPTPMSESSIGDIFWWANAVANPTDTNTELHELASLLSESISLYDQPDYIRTLQGVEGSETIGEYCDQLEGLFSMDKPDIFAFTNWVNFGFTEVNFGWGQPYWVGLMSKPGPAFRNLTVFIETKDGKGIEAWITLDQARMSVLEHDPEFLSFVSPIPNWVSSL